jgi:superfamily II DNA or RNA helicase
VEIDQGERQATGTGDIILASIQSLSHHATTRLAKYNPAEFKAIIIDEVSFYAFVQCAVIFND